MREKTDAQKRLNDVEERLARVENLLVSITRNWSNAPVSMKLIPSNRKRSRIG